MSSSRASHTKQVDGAANPGTARRHVLRGLALGLTAAALAGCGDAGFKPLYGSLGGNNTEMKMAQVEILPIPGRNGQRIRNELIFASTGGGAPLPPKYRLEIAIKETSTTTLVLQNGTSAGVVFQIDARFQLVDIASKKILLEGLSQGRASSERFTNVYSNVRATDDAQDRAARTIATDLKARLSGFLSSQPA